MINAKKLYLEMYGNSGKIPEGLLEAWLRRAVCELDSLTLGRFSPLADNYLMCICDMADCLYQEEVLGGAIKSETIDGYSVTYAEPKASGTRHMDIARRYLSGTGMLYQGVM